jgi:2-hydroxychromene-2-carboxylate isomerase
VGQDVIFFFGPGSRYSYLAATQLPRLERETGARFHWRCVLSLDLIGEDEPDPFAEANRRGQYSSAYRDRDVERWARHYGVPIVMVSDPPDVWRRRARACIAADRLEAGRPFAQGLLRASHAEGRPPREPADFAALAAAAGLVAADLIAAIDDAETATAYAANIAAARAAGAFGVPTFVTADGALFFGQDRLPLLRNHLTA